jgi:hypothetical protein
VTLPFHKLETTTWVKKMPVPHTSNQKLPLLIKLHMLVLTPQLVEGVEEEEEVILTMIAEETTITEDLEIMTTMEIIAEDLIVAIEMQDTVVC